MEIPIQLMSDEKGYLDRECPNENCLYTFKINMQDWQSSDFDEGVHCPMCGHIDSPDSWWTQQQLESMRDIAINYAMNMIHEKLDDAFGKMARSTRKNKYVKITYKPGRRITFKNNPIGQCEEWETDITCEKCGTRYSVIGAAFFCPSCGYNSAVSMCNETLDGIERMLGSLPDMKDLLTKSHGRDKAETICRGLIESSLGDVISAFQKFAECIYKAKCDAPVRVNDFQIVEKGSKLFADIIGVGYDHWLTEQELTRMNLLFQKRHILEHNGGMVDEKYIERSGDVTYTVGQHLVVRTEDTIELIGIIKKLIVGLQSI